MSNVRIQINNLTYMTKESDIKVNKVEVSNNTEVVEK